MSYLKSEKVGGKRMENVSEETPVDKGEGDKIMERTPVDNQLNVAFSSLPSVEDCDDAFVIKQNNLASMSSLSVVENDDKFEMNESPSHVKRYKTFEDEREQLLVVTTDAGARNDKIALSTLSASGSPVSVSASTSSQPPNHPPKQKATVLETSVNIAKASVGIGCLALPHASSYAGYVPYVMITVAVGFWNYYAVDRLIRCERLVSSSSALTLTKGEDIGGSGGKGQHRRTRSAKQRFFQRTSSRNVMTQLDEASLQHMAKGSLSQTTSCPKDVTTFGRVAWHSSGYAGLYFLDFQLIVMFAGVVISMIDLMVEMSQASSVSTGSTLGDKVIATLCIISISFVPGLESVTVFSFLGLTAIVTCFVLVFWYAFMEFGVLGGLYAVRWSHLWPRDFASLCRSFGTVCFSVSVVPLVFNLKESMTEPEGINKATRYGLSFVILLYVTVGVGVSTAFLPESIRSNSDGYFEGDVTDHLPNTWISMVTRLSLAFQLLVTAPLIIIPLEEIITSKLGLFGGEDDPEKKVDQIKGNGDADTNKHSSNGCCVLTELSVRIFVRSVICVVCFLSSVFVGDFMDVIGFVGSFSVAVVSFVLPPWFHLTLSYQDQIDRIGFHSFENIEDGAVPTSYESFSEEEEAQPLVFSGRKAEHVSRQRFRRRFAIDVVMLVLGLSACTVTTIITFQNLLAGSA